jgi:hypothetical protein
MSGVAKRTFAAHQSIVYFASGIVFSVTALVQIGALNRSPLTFRQWIRALSSRQFYKGLLGVYRGGGKVGVALYGVEERKSQHREQRTQADLIAVWTGRLHAAPGWRLHRLGSYVFGRRTFEQVLEPVLSDLQVEYFDALRDGAVGKARIVRLRGYLNFWTHVFAQLPVSILRAAWELWKACQ